ncbi:MAG: putative transcriptional regulator [Lysobacterales bacterium]|jgi:putative transcriptional regulator
MTAGSDNSHEGYLEKQMLIAMPAMADPNFYRSVTVICQHTEEGAIGITINRKSDFNLGEILSQMDIQCDNEEVCKKPVLEGGPVHAERGFVLHSPKDGFESSLELSSGIMISTSRDVLSAIAHGNGPERYVVALGYAGWGDGQLESEMRQNAWLSVPVDRAIVFDLPLIDRWEHAISALGIKLQNLHGEGGHA